VDTSRNIINKSLHINGTVEVSPNMACNACHGSTMNNAPPTDLTGNGATSFRGVGAHQIHLVGGPFWDGASCNECHTVPNAVDAPGHRDTTLPAEVKFGPLAKIGGVSPSWSGTSCANTYCHGNFGGGTSKVPVWTTVNRTQAACGSCHALPPAAPHPNRTDCVSCHPAVVDANRNIINKALHVDGITQTSGVMACNACHGNATNDAPPFDTQGNIATTIRGVGAHQKHLLGGTLADGVPCEECHVVPASVGAAGHNDTPLPAELSFGTLAKTGGALPAWNGTTCANTYCHGKFTGGTTTTPAWTIVDGSQVRCGSACHALPPSTGDHRKSVHINKPCSDCHGSGFTSSAVRIVDHINGRKEVGGTGSKITSWTASTRSCKSTCHGTETW
jgi:predicted CxxxxCH...CXXCH cytochrome family protein